MPAWSSRIVVALAVHGAVLLSSSIGHGQAPDTSARPASRSDGTLLAQAGIGGSKPPGFPPAGGSSAPGERPLQGTIRQDSSTILNAFLKLIPTETKFTHASAELKAACGGFEAAAGQHLAAFRKLRQDAEKCGAWNHTVLDQQAAGCVGSDTLDQCRQKLLKWCMNVKFAADRQDFAKDSQAAIAAAAKVSTEAKEYQDLTKTGLSAYGL